MNFFDKFKRQESPPSYESVAQEMSFVADEKKPSSSLVSPINLSMLSDISNRVNDNICPDFENKITTMIADAIKDKTLRIYIGFHVMQSLTEQIFIETIKSIAALSDTIDNYEAQSWQSCHSIYIFVKNENNKNVLIKRLNDYLNKENETNNFIANSNCYMSLNLSNKFKFENGKLTDCQRIWIKYNNLKGDFLSIYDKKANEEINEEYIKVITDNLTKAASYGDKQYEFKIKNAEFVYEYIKNHKIFNDIKLILASDNEKRSKIVFSWKK
jgi:hypothetical protein